MGKTNANIYANYMAERINGVKPMLDLTLNVKQQITKNDALRFAVYNLLNRDDIRTGSSSAPVLCWRNATGCCLTSTASDERLG